MSEKKWRSPRAKTGELKAQYGKLPDDSPDIVFAWGEGCSRTDAHLLHNVINSERCYLDIEKVGKDDPMPVSYDKSLVDELEARGYDITTLKISIQKKVVTDE